MFLSEYRGQLLSSRQEIKAQETLLNGRQYLPNYNIWFKFKGKQFMLDATFCTIKNPARFANHASGRKQNCKMKIYVGTEKLHLILTTTKIIDPGDELFW